MALSAAAAEGDRSENAEYIYRKKELREIDARIRYLQSRMPQLNIVKEVRDIEYIYFGAKLTLLDHHGKKLFVQIVGADELNSNEYISVDSPLARALLNKTINDVISLDVQGEITTYEVIKIEYDNEITIKV